VVPPLESLERLGDTFALNSPAAERKRMLVIVNPYATTVSDRLKNLVVYALQGRYEVEAQDTQGRNHATELCREAAHEGYDVVVAFGGDGTVNEAANGLAGSATPLTTLPGGATNVYCKMLGIPGDIVDATEHMLRMADDWRPRRVDVAKVNDRYFTFSAGLGLDASVVERVDRRPRLKTRLGAYYYTYAAITTFTRRYIARPPKIGIELPDGTELDGVTVVVQNGEQYTYFNNLPIHMAEGADLDSGTLSGVVLEHTRPTIMPGVMFRALSKKARIVRHGAITGFENVDWLTARTLDDRPVHLQVDGDYIGEVTEARFGVVPEGLAVVS
jgi:diacylglycerol kinase family enzyme